MTSYSILSSIMREHESSCFVVLIPQDRHSPLLRKLRTRADIFDPALGYLIETIIRVQVSILNGIAFPHVYFYWQKNSRSDGDRRSSAVLGLRPSRLPSFLKPPSYGVTADFNDTLQLGLFRELDKYLQTPATPSFHSADCLVPQLKHH